MSLGRILAIAKRIVKQFVHDHRTTAMIIVVPLVLLTLLGFLFKTDRIFNVGIVNQDQGFTTSTGDKNLSSPIVTSFKDSSVLKWHQEDLDQAKNDLKNQTLDVYVVFDKDFTQKVLASQKPTLSVNLEGSDPSYSGQVLSIVSNSLYESFSSQKSVTIAISYLYGGSNYTSLDYFAPVFIAFFAFLFVFLLTSVSFLRERTQGTIEKLLVSPVTNIEIVLGYFLGFLAFALVQSLIVLLFTIYVLQVHFVGNILNIFLIELILIVGGVNLGILLSAFARNELQVIQFIPLVVVSQGLLSGLIWPIKSMPIFLQWVSYAMPLTYANNALRDIMIRGFDLTKVSTDIFVLIGFALVLIFLASASIRQAN